MTEGFDHDRRTYRSAPDTSRDARSFVAGFFRRAGAPDDIVDDFELVTSELVANAVQHGGGLEVVVSVESSDAVWWTLAVCCRADPAVEAGLAIHLRAAPPPTPAAAGSGRGLGIVRHLMDDVGVDVKGHELTVTCRRRRTVAA